MVLGLQRIPDACSFLVVNAAHVLVRFEDWKIFTVLQGPIATLDELRLAALFFLLLFRFLIMCLFRVDLVFQRLLLLVDERALNGRIGGVLSPEGPVHVKIALD